MANMSADGVIIPEMKPIRFTINDPRKLKEIIFRLETDAAEMGDLNPKNQPIKGQTKDRWRQTMDDTIVFLKKCLPKEETENAR